VRKAREGKKGCRNNQIISGVAKEGKTRLERMEGKGGENGKTGKVNIVLWSISNGGGTVKVRERCSRCLKNANGIAEKKEGEKGKGDRREKLRQGGRQLRKGDPEGNVEGG